jgi:predicted CXXCH cytochrome family protein
MALDGSRREALSPSQGTFAWGHRWVLTAGVALVSIAAGVAAYWWQISRETAAAVVPGEQVDDEEFTAPVNDYLGVQACAACHARRVREFLTTSHYRTSRLPQAGEMPPGFAPGKGGHVTRYPAVRFDMTRTGQDFFQTTLHATPAGEQRTASRIDLVYGAGHADEVYFTWRGDRLYQLPMVWLHPQQRWANISFNRYGGGDFSREGTARCLECHTTWFEHVAGTANQYRPDSFLYGVTCERCHGPGREHVGFHESHPGEKVGRSIVNPSALTRERQLEVCTQCHSNATRRLRPPFSYRPGEPLATAFRTTPSKHPEDDHVANQIRYLRESKCFQKSDSLSCTTCHDPHAPEGPGHATLVRQSCLQCHQPAQCAERLRLPAAVRDDCVGCHMPRRVWMNVHFHTEKEPYVPPATRHEHQIAVYPSARQEVLLGWYRSQSDAASRQEASRLTQELVRHWLAEADAYRRSYRFLAEIGAVREALELDPSPPVHARFEEAVAIESRLENDLVEAQREIDGQHYSEAIYKLKEILRVKPDAAGAHGKLGTCYAVTGQGELAARHLKTVAENDPNNSYGWSMLGWLAYLQDQPEEALDYYRRAEEIEPYNAKLNYHMGLALTKLGRWPDAAERFRRVLTLDPNHVGGSQGLCTALLQQGQAVEALRFAKKAARLTRYENADVLLTLADCYAEAGRFSEAQDTAARALAANQEGDAGQTARIRRRLEDFRKKGHPR